MFHPNTVAIDFFATRQASAKGADSRSWPDSRTALNSGVSSMRIRRKMARTPSGSDNRNGMRQPHELRSASDIDEVTMRETTAAVAVPIPTAAGESEPYRPRQPRGACSTT